MQRLTTPALMAALLGLAACASTGARGDVRPHHVVLYGYASAAAVPTTRVLRDADELDVLWREHTAREVDRPPLPDVDWSRDMLIFVALGERPTGGYAVRVDAIEERGDRLVVRWSEVRPAPDAFVPAVVTRPYCLVATARRGGQVEFERAQDGSPTGS